MDGRNVQEIFYVVVKNVRPAGNKALPEADGWVERGHRAELARLQAEADRLDYNFLQKQIMMETSFSGSEGKLDVFPFQWEKCDPKDTVEGVKVFQIGL